MHDYGEPDLFDWSELVHSTDGACAHEAAHRADNSKGIDRQITWGLWNRLLVAGDYPHTRKGYQLLFLPGIGFSMTRSESLRRRLSDLICIKTHHNPNLWLIQEVNAKINGSAILQLTDRGRAVLENPKIMVGCWNQAINPKH
jgi:hypothetical protein